MEAINVNILRTEYAKLEEKLSLINQIPKLECGGNNFEGMDFEDDGIIYRTNQYYSGCGTDYYSFFIAWDEINNPIEYFKLKFAKEIEEDKIKKEESLKIADKIKEEKELQELKRLHHKYKGSVMFGVEDWDKFKEYIPMTISDEEFKDFKPSKDELDDYSDLKNK